MDEIGTHFGMKGSAISQLSRRFKERIKTEEELAEILCKIRREVLLNVETCPQLLSLSLGKTEMENNNEHYAL